MSTSLPVPSHPLQLVLWNQVMMNAAKDGVPEFVNKPEYAKLLDTEPHHHVPALAFGIQAFLGTHPGAEKLKLEVEYDVDGLDRATFRITDGGYVAVEEVSKKPVYTVDVSYYVYTESLTVHKSPKAKEDEVEDDANDKVQKLVTKIDANIPVVFAVPEKKMTRHYQEARPMHVHAGMTNLLVANMVEQIAGFLLTGTLPPNIK